MKMARAYQQTLRAQKAAENADRILDEAERLFTLESFDRVSLATVAAAAGVSVPTLQRRFGNKEGLFAAAGERVRARVMSQRRSPTGDIDGALDSLLEHYEIEGRMVWHWLKQEADVPILGVALKEGRATHRAWVEEIFAAALCSLSGEARERKVDAIVAATDIYLWKLLRVDLGRPREHVAHVMKAMAHAVAGGES